MEQATAIEVKLGEKLSGYDITATKTLPVRKIQGIVLWNDGTPASNAVVAVIPKLDAFLSNGHRVRTNAKGQFTLTAGAGLKYWLCATADKFPDKSILERNPVYAEPLPLELKEELKDGLSGIRLVLTLDKKAFESEVESKNKDL